MANFSFKLNLDDNMKLMEIINTIVYYNQYFQEKMLKFIDISIKLKG